MFDFTEYVTEARPFVVAKPFVSSVDADGSDEELIGLIKEFRKKVREESVGNGEYGALKACDWLRDCEAVKSRNIVFEDEKVVDRSKSKRNAKKAKEEDEKEVRVLGTAKATLDSVKDGKSLPLPRQMFSTGPNRELYSAYEADGIPCRYMDGSDVEEEEKERLRKEKKVYIGVYWARKSMRH
jgi:hypothetical protein